MCYAVGVCTDQGNTGEKGSASAGPSLDEAYWERHRHLPDHGRIFQRFPGDPGPSIIPGLIADIDLIVTQINDTLAAATDLERQRDLLLAAKLALVTEAPTPPRPPKKQSRKLTDEELQERRERIAARKAADPNYRGPGRPPKDIDHQAAGPAAIEKVSIALARVGRTTQAELARDTKLHSGTITHALRALGREDPPKAAKTGERFRGSNEWTWLGEPPRTTVIDVGDSVHEGRRVRAS